MQFKNTLIVFISASFLLSCSSTPNQLRNLIWLQGEWHAQKDSTLFIETWKMQDDSTMLGKGSIVEGGDTTVFENIQLLQKKDAFYYVVNLPNKPNAIYFRFIGQKTNARAASFLFQRVDTIANSLFEIQYEQLLNDKMRVKLSMPNAKQKELIEFKQVK
ncbi:MAG: DUF6265 family protein [Bacteroidota bacterium]|jgi:hypothetical protein